MKFYLLPVLAAACWPAASPAVCRAQSVLPVDDQLLDQDLICDAVRWFPRAGFAGRMTGGEIQGSNESATSGFVTLATIEKLPPENQWTRLELKN